MLNHVEILIKSLIESKVKITLINQNPNEFTEMMPTQLLMLPSDKTLPLFDQGKVVEEIEYEPYQAIGAPQTW